MNYHRFFAKWEPILLPLLFFLFWIFFLYWCANQALIQLEQWDPLAFPMGLT